MTRTPPRSVLVAFLILVAAAFAVYAWTAAPTVLFGDSGEMQIVGAAGGIPHATGYPGFVLASRALVGLGWGDLAHRVNLVCALFSALAVGLMFVLLRALEIAPWSAAAAAGCYALTFTVWRVGQRAEVYSISIALLLLATWRSVVALRTGRMRDLLLAGFLLGLTMTGHFSSGMLVIALGLALAWRAFRGGSRPVPRLAALAAAFALGWLPYLYLAWADAQPGGYNYLRIVDSVINPLGRPMPAFDSAWERVSWLITGMNRYGGPFVPADSGTLARSIYHVLASHVLFDPGPVAMALVVVGVWQFRRLPIRFLLPSAVVLLALLVFGSRLANGPMINVVLMPFTALLMIPLARGLEEAARERLPANATTGLAGIAAGAVVALIVALPAHALRVHADRKPIGHFQVTEEGAFGGERPGLVPSMRGLRSARRFGEAVLDTVPRGALVVALWPEFTPLVYLNMVEKRRPDVTVQIMSPEGLPERIAVWQRSRPSPGPVVFIGRPADSVANAAPLDSMNVGGRGWIYLRRAR
jgi:hypothetical protein